VLEYPVANAGVYQDIEAERFVLNLNGTGTSVEGIAPYDSVSYKWTTDIRDLQVINPDSLNKATVELKDEKTLVTLTVMNFGKCPVTDTARVVMKSSIDIPNVFSPNGDGNHDFFEIKNLNKLYPDAVLTIFNKWGSVVYVSGAGYPEPWDGKRNGEDMPVATYYYILDTKGGRTYSPGSVTIIR
jgi:gliding motility-associated-like protein